MHRKPLLAMLARYAARYPAEQGVAARVSQLVRARADCLERVCLPGHITGSAWVVSHDRKRILLVHHRKLGRWLQPGGHADGQAAVEQVALREAIEESGIADLRLAPLGPEPTPLDVDVHLIPARFDAQGRQTEPEHEHHDIRFLVLAGHADAPQVSEESHAVAWFTPDEVRQLTQEESVLRMLRKANHLHVNSV